MSVGLNHRPAVVGHGLGNMEVGIVISVCGRFFFLEKQGDVYGAFRPFHWSCHAKKDDVPALLHR